MRGGGPRGHQKDGTSGARTLNEKEVLEGSAARLSRIQALTHTHASAHHTGLQEQEHKGKNKAGGLNMRSCQGNERLAFRRDERGGTAVMGERQSGAGQ